MKVKIRNEDIIEFDNGTPIEYSHFADCCEYNYADFSQLDNTGFDEFNFPEKLEIEIVEDYGFRVNGFFIPCYSQQNGYYSSDVDIIITYPNKSVERFNLCCQETE